MSQAELAAEVGIAQRSVSNYERDFTMPTFLVLQAWGRATQVKLGWIAYGESAAAAPNAVTWREARRGAIKRSTIWSRTRQQVRRVARTPLIIVK